MRVYFKYPNIERGMDINIVMHSIGGIKHVSANGEPAKLIDPVKGQYEYYDPNLGRNRLIAIVNTFLDNPQFYIDGKEVHLYPRIPKFFKIFVFLPFIYAMMFPSIIFGSCIMAILNVIFNFFLVKTINNNILRVLFVVLMTGVWLLITMVTLEAIGALLGIEPPTSSSSSSLISSAATIFKNLFF